MQKLRNGRVRRLATLVVAVGIAAAVTSGAVGADHHATKTPPKLTIGFLNILGASPATGRMEKQFKRAARMLGWKVNVIDAQGDPAKMASGVQSFVTQKVSAILTIAVPPSIANQALTAAKKAHIPAITIGSPNPDPHHLYAAQISPNDSALGAINAQYLCDTLGSGAKIVAQEYSALDALVRRDTVAEALFKLCGVKVVATHQVDMANAVSDATKSTLDMLRANPGVTGVYADQDFEFAAAVSAINQLGLQKKVKVFGFLAGAETLATLRKGGPAAGLADAAYNDIAWIAANQFLMYFGQHKKIDPNAQYNDMQIPTALITAKNVPKTGDEFKYPDPAKTFVPRWKALGYTLNK